MNAHMNVWMSHKCLTRSALLELIELEPPLVTTLPTSLRAMKALSHCDACWKPFKAVGTILEGKLYETTNPFATLFRTLATRHVRRISHKKALDDVRKPFGLYRLLLEEIIDLVPVVEPRDGQHLFLLFEVVLSEISSTGHALHDLRARAACYQSVYYERLELPARAGELQREAEHHLRRGSKDPDLRATFLACQAERLHAKQQHDDAFAHMRRALDLVEGDRRAELLVFLASIRRESQKPGDRQMQKAWEHLLEAEHLVEIHAPYFLEAVLRKLLVVESALVALAGGPLSLLLRCLRNHHMRRLGLGEWKFEDDLPSCQMEESGFAALFLAWSEGQPIDESAWEEVTGQLTSSTQSRVFADTFQAQLIGLWERYPDGHLAEAFLKPLMDTFERLRPAA